MSGNSATSETTAPDRLGDLGLVASVVAVIGASMCCIGPITAAFLGLTSLGALSKYEFLRPWFTVLTLGFLAWAFWLAYRPTREAECEPGSVCDTHGPSRVKRLNRIVLWIVTVLVVIIWTFPTWSTWLL